MNEEMIREVLDGIKRELDNIEERQKALRAAHDGLESLLRLGIPFKGGGLPLFSLPPNGSNEPKGRVSYRSTVLRVIKEARGQPLHTAEIHRRARQLGASTAAKDPTAITDLLGYSLLKSGQPIEKCAPRTWRWTGDGA
jgi:hypothetical protein